MIVDFIETKISKFMDSIKSFVKKNFFFLRRILSVIFMPLKKIIELAKKLPVFSSIKKTRILRNHVVTKYLVKELTLYFSVAFLFFFLVFFVNEILLVVENVLKQRVPLEDVLRLIAYSLPMIIAQSSPFATLVGFLMCLGRIMSDNEILIFRASGLGYKCVAIPVILMGIFISVVSFFVNDYLLPVGKLNYNRLLREIVASNPGVEIEPNSVKRLNNATIVIGDGGDEFVEDLVIIDKSNDDSQRIIVSKKSSLKSSKKAGILMQMNMNDSISVFLDNRNRTDYDVLEADTATMNIFDSAVFAGNFSVSPTEMTSFDLKTKIEDLKKIKGHSKKQLNAYITEFHKKFSQPFGSLFFALLALPLAFLFGKHNGQTIGLVVGLLISVLYWAMMIMNQIFAIKVGSLNGVLAMWLPDGLIGFSAIIFFLVLMRK